MCILGASVGIAFLDRESIHYSRWTYSPHPKNHTRIPGSARPEPRDGYMTGRWVAPRSAAWSSIALPMACAARSTNSVPLPITQSRDACGPSSCPVKCGITYCANSS